METAIIVLGVLWFSSFLALGLIIKAQNQEMQRLTRLGYDNSILQDQNSASIKKLMEIVGEIEDVVFPNRQIFRKHKGDISIVEDINLIGWGLKKLARELGYEITFDPEPEKVVIKKKEEAK